MAAMKRVVLAAVVVVALLVAALVHKVMRDREWAHGGDDVHAVAEIQLPKPR
jgi:hypothetical protein